MARKYCFCASNLFCSKILGSIGILVVMINFALWILTVIGAQRFHPVFVLPLIINWVALLANICLIVGAVKRKQSLLLVWICLSIVSLLLNLVVFIIACVNRDGVSIVSNLGSILITLWCSVIVFGAYKELSEIQDIFQYRLFYFLFPYDFQMTLRLSSLCFAKSTS